MKTNENGKSGNFGNQTSEETIDAAFDEKCRQEISGKEGNFTMRWDDPLPFNDYDLPDIPAVLLPSPLKEFATALSDHLETPQGAAVLCLLSIAATAVQGKFDVALSKNYHEPLNLYLLVAMPPANRKSPILKQCLAPLRAYETEMKKKLEPAIVRERSVYQSKKQEIELLRKKLNTENNATLIEEIADKESSLKEPSVLPKLFLTDTTTESLAIALEEQNGKISLISDEGGLIDTWSGLYSGGIANIDILLKGWDGGDIRIKRRDREIFISPLITLFLIVQPVILENLAKNKVFCGKGFFERFLFCVPASKIGYRKNNLPLIREEYIQDYYKLIADLIKISGGSKSLHLSDPALALWKDFQNSVEYSLRNGQKLYDCQGWGGKICGQILRIAGLLHLAQTRGVTLTIKENTMQNAIQIGELLILHAQKVFNEFSFYTDNRTREAKSVWNAIKQINKLCFTQKELTVSLRHKMLSDKIKELLPILIERNLISEPFPSNGGRTLNYLVNPSAFEKDKEYGQN